VTPRSPAPRGSRIRAIAHALPVTSSATQSRGSRLWANNVSASGRAAIRPAERTRPSATIATSQKSRWTSSATALTCPSSQSPDERGRPVGKRQRRIRARSATGQVAGAATEKAGLKAHRPRNGLPSLRSPKGPSSRSTEPRPAAGRHQRLRRAVSCPAKEPLGRRCQPLSLRTPLRVLHYERRRIIRPGRCARAHARACSASNGSHTTEGLSSSSRTTPGLRAGTRRAAHYAPAGPASWRARKRTTAGYEQAFALLKPLSASSITVAAPATLGGGPGPLKLSAPASITVPPASRTCSRLAALSAADLYPRNLSASGRAVLGWTLARPTSGGRPNGGAPQRGPTVGGSPRRRDALQSAPRGRQPVVRASQRRQSHRGAPTW
jgi:hypothetical protein